MMLAHMVDNLKDELPGFSIVGYLELALPIFKRNLHCLMLEERKLPVVTEFVLHYYNYGLNISEISTIMGIDQDLIEEAWLDLVQIDFINNDTKKITPLGNDYLNAFKINKYENALVPVCIDGLTGHITKDILNLMSHKQTREIGVKSLRNLIDYPSIDNIDFQQIKKVIKDYKKIDPESYGGILLDVIKLDGSTTRFKRLNVLVFSNIDEETRFLVYEGKDRAERYEDALLKMDYKNHQVIKLSFGDYYTNRHDIFNKISKNKKTLSPGQIFDEWNNIMNSVKSELIIALPLIDMCGPDDYIVSMIEKTVERNVNVFILLCGTDYSGIYQKNQCDKILSHRKKFKNLQVFHNPSYCNKFIIRDQETGVISDFSRHKLNLPTSKESYVEHGCIMSIEDIKICYDFVNPLLKKQIDIDLNMYNGEWLINKIKEIAGLVNEADEKMRSVNELGWLGDNPIPEFQKLIEAPLASNEDAFKSFINSMNKSLVESVEYTGINSKIRNYFWNDFKHICPGLHRVLHKIRVYRNRANHLTLDENNSNLYYNFLNEDLGGMLPSLVNKGYLVIQVKIIEEMIDILKKYLKP